MSHYLCRIVSHEKSYPDPRTQNIKLLISFYWLYSIFNTYGIIKTLKHWLTMTIAFKSIFISVCCFSQQPHRKPFATIFGVANIGFGRRDKGQYYLRRGFQFAFISKYHILSKCIIISCCLVVVVELISVPLSLPHLITSGIRIYGWIDLFTYY